jgi:multiple sugar transport system ATP-binding protein
MVWLDTVSEGEFRIGDRVVNEVSPKDHNIAMVFQSYAVYPSMSVRENIEFGMRTTATHRRNRLAADRYGGHIALRPRHRDADRSPRYSRQGLKIRFGRF